MSKPTIRSGKLTTGAYFTCGENVVINVAEEVVIGDRCKIPDNTYFEGRSITIGDDFYGYDWDWRRLDVGRGRIDEENAILKIGNRCTLHDNKIDLSGEVIIGNDVGLSPEVTIYTHYYWQSKLMGYPQDRAGVQVGDKAIIGYRSLFLPGAYVGYGTVVGAQAVIHGYLEANSVYVGNPARKVKEIVPLPISDRMELLNKLLKQYEDSCRYRGITCYYYVNYPKVMIYNCVFDVEEITVTGDEGEMSDDFREYMFRFGIRFYTERPFRKITRRRVT